MSKTIIISSEQDRIFCYSYLERIKADGKNEVNFKLVDQRYTAKQNRLRWMWSTELSDAGIGMYDTPDEIHLISKWDFVLPIILKDDPPMIDEETGEEVPGMFTQIYIFFMEKFQSSDRLEKHKLEFADRYIRTGNLTRQQGAESLTNFQKYWTHKGVNLTDPKMQGCDLEKMAKGKK